MIGCILTGHGSFATGLGGALEMIAGQQEIFETVCFLEEKLWKRFLKLYEMRCRRYVKSAQA